MLQVIGINKSDCRSSTACYKRLYLTLGDEKMPTGKQIRAARVFLDWDAADLAAKVGIRRETILSIENNLSHPRASTMDKIIRVFDENGIEFVGERGTALKNDQVVTLTGENVFFRVLDDIMATLGDTKKEALFACVNDRLSPPIVIENCRRLRKAGIRMKFLVKEGDTYLMGDVKEYRYLPAHFFANTPQVIYGDKVVTMLYSEGKNNEIVRSALIMRNAYAASVQRNLFNFIWSVAQKPEKSDANIRYDEQIK